MKIVRSFVALVFLSILCVGCGGAIDSPSHDPQANIVEAASLDHDFAWALAQPLNTVVTRAAWSSTGLTVKRIAGVSVTYPYGKWVHVGGWTPGARYTPSEADRMATDWGAP